MLTFSQWRFLRWDLECVGLPCVHVKATASRSVHARSVGGPAQDVGWWAARRTAGRREHAHGRACGDRDRASVARARVVDSECFATAPLPRE
jgi:hypothetical protein